MDCIHYKCGYKYQLTRDYEIQTGIPAPFDIVTEWIDYAFDGTLTVRAGYAWDGPSGPTLDTADAMRASLVHDALYQLMRAGKLNPEYYRQPADKLFRRLCLEDGMWQVRAEAWYDALRLAAAGAADGKNEKREICAPRDCA